MNDSMLFVACPIGPDNSPTRKRSDGVFKHLIEPVIRDAAGSNAQLVRADQIGRPGRISTQILQQLVKANVVIADLTDLNSNVLYELVIRQALFKTHLNCAKGNGTAVRPQRLQNHFLCS